MQKELRWLLPAGIEEVLPPQARVIEGLRRDLLDLYDRWGFELVIPPFIDYLDSLRVGTGRDLERLTFKLTDQESGRLLGLRADMTPQVARIDAHNLRREGPTRLCYLGTVLRTDSRGFAETRSPLQIGAEIYGHAGIESDVEILRLMLLTLQQAGLPHIHLDLGHVGIYRGLARQAGLDAETETALFDALQRKAIPELEERIRACELDDAMARMLLTLADLNGGEILERARRELAQASAEVQAALEYLGRVAAQLRTWLPAVPVHFDLAELRGYHYKTGVVFAAFVPGWGQEIARGGRYDEIGRVFGRARPAVGFSTDLKGLLRHGRGLEARYQASPGILAPCSPDPALQAAVARLRAEGHRVVSALPGQTGGAREAGCREQLVWREGDWVRVPA